MECHDTHVSKISGAFPTYKKITRNSTKTAQWKFCTGKGGAITGKNGAVKGKNGAFQHQNLKPYLFPKEQRMPKISAAMRWTSNDQHHIIYNYQNFAAARVPTYTPQNATKYSYPGPSARENARKLLQKRTKIHPHRMSNQKSKCTWIELRMKCHNVTKQKAGVVSGSMPYPSVSL
jgi:hypothetical protein